jgi:imidazolonepropionase-like amidohydrolase
MEVLTATPAYSGSRVAVHIGAAEGYKQAIRFSARSIEHEYLIDAEGLPWVAKAGACIVPPCR